MLDSGDPEAGHAGPIDRALPAGEFLEGEAVTLASLVDREKAAIDRRHDFRLAPNDPAGGARGRQSLDRQWFAQGADHVSGADVLVLDQSFLKLRKMPAALPLTQPL